MIDIKNTVYNAVERILPERIRSLASQYQNAIRYQANDAMLAGKLKVADALRQVVVEIVYNSINDIHMILKSDYFSDPDIGDDVKFYSLDVAKPYALA